jgi:hypothetical protein
MLLPLRWLLYGMTTPTVEETGVGGKRRPIRHRKPPKIGSKPPGYVTWTNAIVPSNYELEQRALKKQIAEEDEVIARLASQL